MAAQCPSALEARRLQITTKAYVGISVQIIYNPSLMFEFEPFKTAFAREIIPAQVVLGRSPILFNPARLMIFGNP
jgi:hypothetical protein